MINVDACVCLQRKMGGVGPSDDDHIQKIEDNDSMGETEYKTNNIADMNDDSIAGIDRELEAMK
jgi:hypothetical protein